MLFQVPGGRSSPGLPGMVTRPVLTGCLYWRWLPCSIAMIRGAAAGAFGRSVQRLHCPPNPYLSTCWMVQRLTSRSLASSRWLTPFDRSTRM